MALSPRHGRPTRRVLLMLLRVWCAPDLTTDSQSSKTTQISLPSSPLQEPAIKEAAVPAVRYRVTRSQSLPQPPGPGRRCRTAAVTAGGPARGPGARGRADSRTEPRIGLSGRVTGAAAAAEAVQ
eukprot:759209-Hanusia_phi.AAC.9